MTRQPAGIDPLAEGGRKVWPERICALSDPHGSWREIGRLPGACGFGVSATGRNHFVIPSGEVAPGIRTPSVLTFPHAP